MDKRIWEAMHRDALLPLNPSSAHLFGQRGGRLLAGARATVAQFLDVQPREIAFTSGGTESMNLLIRGSCKNPDTDHLITTDLEHPATYYTCKDLEKRGFSVTYLSPGPWGTPKPIDIERALQKKRASLIALSAANSETGVRADFVTIAQIAHEAKIPLILDGVALLGKERFFLPQGVTGMGFSAHKIHGPKGVGFAFVRSSSPLLPLLTGGNQENRLRSGTENLMGIMGLAQAITLIDREIDVYQTHMRALRDRLENGLKRKIPNLTINGDGPRIANTSNLYFPGVDGENLFIGLDMRGIAVSHASACSSRWGVHPSRVLRHMGFSRERAKSSLRFSLSRMNTREEIDRTIETIDALIGHFQNREATTR